MEQKVVKTVVKNSVKKNNQVVVEKISHIKQHSIDSGVGSQMGSSHGIIPNGSSNTLRTRPVSLSNSQKIQHVRSISENALLTSPQFSIYEKVHITCGIYNQFVAFDRSKWRKSNIKDGINGINNSRYGIYLIDFDSDSSSRVGQFNFNFIYFILMTRSSSEQDGFRQ